MNIEEIREAIEYFKLTTMLNTELNTQEEHHTALAVLQEQLERMEGCGWCHHCSNCIYSTDDKDDAPCSCCEVKGMKLTNFAPRSYCGNCGKILKKRG